jgi:hypothetical protein
MKSSDVISGSVIRAIKNYNEFLCLNDPKIQRKLFKGIATFYDLDSSPINHEDDEILDIVDKLDNKAGSLAL